MSALLILVPHRVACVWPNWDTHVGPMYLSLTTGNQFTRGQHGAPFAFPFVSVVGPTYKSQLSWLTLKHLWCHRCRLLQVGMCHDAQVIFPLSSLLFLFIQVCIYVNKHWSSWNAMFCSETLHPGITSVISTSFVYKSCLPVQYISENSQLNPVLKWVMRWFKMIVIFGKGHWDLLILQ